MDCVGPELYKGKCVRGRDVVVIDCKACGFAHIHPKPTKEETEAYYREVYYETEKPEYKQQHDDLDDYWQQVYEEQLEVGFRYESSGYQPYVLDVGCGHQAPFLKAVRKRWPGKHLTMSRLYGMDPALSPGFVVTDDGITLFSSWAQVDEGRPREGWFDIINLGFVLEHVPNPAEVLWECHERLSDGGALVVEVPFDFNPIQNFHFEHAVFQGTRQNAWWTSSPDHVNYFVPGSLADLVRRCGFYVREQGTTYPVELFILHGTDYRTDEVARKLSVKERALLQRFWRESGMSRQTKIGRTTWLIAGKA